MLLQTFLYWSLQQSAVANSCATFQENSLKTMKQNSWSRNSKEGGHNVRTGGDCLD